MVKTITNININNYIDQDVSNDSSPSFNNVDLQTISSNGLTFTMPSTSGQLALDGGIRVTMLI